jgi:hypothetical protein
MPMLFISSKSRLKNRFHFLGRVKTTVSIRQYFPMFCMIFTGLI